MPSPPQHPDDHRKPLSFFQEFSRSQVASAVATLFDYGVLFGLAELAHLWYVFAVACGALAGAISNFLLNRHWSFQATHTKASRQALKYAIVSFGSLLLNTGGVYLVTEHMHIHYAISVVIVSLLVGFLFNFPLQRSYVFK
jgi:putative flippase GtrA